MSNVVFEIVKDTIGGVDVKYCFSGDENMLTVRGQGEYINNLAIEQGRKYVEICDFIRLSSCTRIKPTGTDRVFCYAGYLEMIEGDDMFTIPVIIDINKNAVKTGNMLTLLRIAEGMENLAEGLGNCTGLKIVEKLRVSTFKIDQYNELHNTVCYLLTI
jgi:hypothetical protein